MADEIALRDENAKLSVENGRLSNQLHSACGELKKVKTKNAALRTKVSEVEHFDVLCHDAAIELQEYAKALKGTIDKKLYK